MRAVKQQQQDRGSILLESSQPFSRYSEVVIKDSYMTVQIKKKC